MPCRKRAAEQARACFQMALLSGKQPLSMQMRQSHVFLTLLRESSIWDILAWELTERGWPHTGSSTSVCLWPQYPRGVPDPSRPAVLLGTRCH